MEQFLSRLLLCSYIKLTIVRPSRSSPRKRATLESVFLALSDFTGRAFGVELRLSFNILACVSVQMKSGRYNV
jgi:hypothetical protein